MIILNGSASAVTVVANRFIDEYMAGANGEYVKVYLYLLRASQNPASDFSVTQLADLLDDTEKDVIRALRYWEKEGWLALEQDAAGVISGIRTVVPGETVSPKITEEAAAVSAPEPAKQAAKKPGAGSHKLTPEAMEQLSRDEDFSQFTFAAEAYLGRTLTSKDIQLFAYLYDDLRFPADLLEYLVEYCVDGGHKSCRYMESVALGWHQEGKLTLQQAKEANKAYSRENKMVMKAFGITNRVLNEEERGYIEKWIREYGFSLDVVTEACKTTVSAIQKPSFQYTESILEDWRTVGVHTVEEARKRREDRKNRLQETPVRAVAGGNRFQNYQQRNIDYDALLSQGGLNPYGGNH